MTLTADLLRRAAPDRRRSRPRDDALLRRAGGDVEGGRQPRHRRRPGGGGVILPVLRALTPDIPVISEEEAAAGVSPEVTRRHGSGWSIRSTAPRNSSSRTASSR